MFSLFAWMLMLLGVIAIAVLIFLLLGSVLTVAGGLLYCFADILIALAPIILIVMLIKHHKKKKREKEEDLE